MLSNLPPGVTENMIPGNRPEDIRYDAYIEDVLNIIYYRYPFLQGADDTLIDIIGMYFDEGYDEDDAADATMEYVKVNRIERE